LIGALAATASVVCVSEVAIVKAPASEPVAVAVIVVGAVVSA
jgi:hypothetical protein